MSGKSFCVLAVLILCLTACKVGDDDPWISFRSRNNRFIGYWDFGLVMTDSTKLHLKWDIRKDGTVFQRNNQDSFVYCGNWAWLRESGDIERKESFTIEDETHTVFKFTILRLTKSEMKVYYYLNNNSTQFNTYFNRIEK